MNEIIVAIIGSGVLAALISGCFSIWSTRYNNKANIKNKNRMDTIDNIAKPFTEVLSESYFLNDIEGYLQPSEILSRLENMRVNLIYIKILLYDIEYNKNLIKNITRVNELLSESIKLTRKEAQLQEGVISVESGIDSELHKKLIELEEDITKYILTQRERAESHKC